MSYAPSRTVPGGTGQDLEFPRIETYQKGRFP